MALISHHSKLILERYFLVTVEAVYERGRGFTSDLVLRTESSIRVTGRDALVGEPGDLGVEVVVRVHIRELGAIGLVALNVRVAVQERRHGLTSDLVLRTESSIRIASRDALLGQPGDFLVETVAGLDVREGRDRWRIVARLTRIAVEERRHRLA